MNKPLSPSRFLLLIFLCIIGIGLLFALIDKKPPPGPPATGVKKTTQKEPTKQEPVKQSEPTREPAKTPKEIIELAKHSLNLRTDYFPQGNIYNAGYLLDRLISELPKDAPELPEAKELQKKINKLKDKEIAKRRAEAAKEQLAKRLLYAPILENRLLDKGFDTTVKTMGKDHTTLQIKWVLTSRVMVHQFSKDTTLIQNWRDMGFKKVVFTDGFRSKWVMDL